MAVAGQLYFTYIGQKGVNWLHLSQYRNQWRAVVDTVMNLQVQGGECFHYQSDYWVRVQVLTVASMKVTAFLVLGQYILWK
jgi:hypothetical protein